MKIYQSRSSAKTRKLGKELAEIILRRGTNRPKAAVIALEGDLGSGKTTFTQGFLRGLGIKKRTASPTFIIMRRFSLPNRNFHNFFHLDVYRLQKAKDLKYLGFKKIISEPYNIVLIEWADKIKSLLPKSAIKVRFFHDHKENERTIKMNL